MMQVFFNLCWFLVGAVCMMMVYSHRKTELMKQLENAADTHPINEFHGGWCYGVLYAKDQIERFM